MNRTTDRRNAFTLVELLAVIVLIAMFSAMVATATNGVTRVARQKRTEKIIAACDAVIQERYQSYKYRPYAVEIPDLFRVIDPTNGNNVAGEIGFDVLAPEAARVRLMMVRDLQRMELPDRLSDIVDAPTVIRAAASPVVTVGNQIVSTRNDKTRRRMFAVDWYSSGATYVSGNDNIPSKLAAYRERIRSLEVLNGLAFGTYNITAAAATNQGSECLYLIMASSFVGGRPAINAIPAGNVADTDGDGLLEILDGWGQPLEFVRWPVGYKDPEQSTIVSPFNPSNPALTPIPDDFDLFRADYAYHIDPSASTLAVPYDVEVAAAAAAGPVVAEDLKPWSIRPLIFSRGADKTSGVATDPWENATTPRPDFSYRHSDWNWPVTGPPGIAYYGLEIGGRAQGIGTTTFAEHPFPDPYLRRFVNANGGLAGFTGLLPGQVLPSALAAEAASDNVTNFALQAGVR